ncbi:phosphatidylinositol-4-phosphate 3-kinase catalytic subunit Pi3K68D [Rhodnius prolixus]|uniref:phosphatidylinositol-4-phosphate 3-kinase catalytic subunit Pi3K68D n=1 Tax=Rhodnius prolixus TaxID=13249 RepID=UPI003D18B12C
MSRSSSTNIDHERKFQEDLEKAQALSLESLALEKFRLEKLKKSEKVNTNFSRHTSTTIRTCDTSESRTNSYLESTSRPRPRNISAAPSVPILRPPPPALRRNSVNTSTDSQNTDDLISFNSPSGSKQQSRSEITQFEINESLEINYNTQCLNQNLYKPVQIYNNTSYKTCNFTKKPQHNDSVRSMTAVTHTTTSQTDGESNLDVLKIFEKKSNSNLIDLGVLEADNGQGRERNRSVRVSLLEAFDPLLTNNVSQTEQQSLAEEDDAEDSIYDPFDPFDFLYSTPSIHSQNSDPIYATVQKTNLTPTSTPIAISKDTKSTHNLQNKIKVNQPRKLYETVMRSQRFEFIDSDLSAFHQLIAKLRGDFVHSDSENNRGIMISPTIANSYNFGTSVKLVIHCPNMENPLIFTSSVSSSVEHILLHIACEAGYESIEEYILKVHGLAEYLNPEDSLADYEYVHECIKLEKDIELKLLRKDSLNRMLIRTAEDDKRDQQILLDDLLPKDPVQPISFDSLLILLETLEKEMDRVIAICKDLNHADNTCMDTCPSLQSKSVMQAVKAICSLLGNVETLELSQAIEAFTSVCDEFPKNRVNSQLNSWTKPSIIEEDGEYSLVILSSDNLAKNLNSHCDKIRLAVLSLIQVYTQIYRVDFHIPKSVTKSGIKFSSEIYDTCLLYIGCLHRLSQNWNYNEYRIEVQIYHGTRPIGQRICTPNVVPSSKFYQRVVFDCWLSFENISISSLPRESRIVLVICGNTYYDEQTQEAQQQVELGWTALQLFDYDGYLTQGNFLLTIWPGEHAKKLGPAPYPGNHPHSDIAPIVGIELPDYGGDIKFPHIDLKPEKYKCEDFESLDPNTQQQLLDIIDQDTFSNPLVEDREVLWEKRHYLVKHAKALPKVLLAAHSWDYTCLPDLHAMLCSWAPMDPVNSLQLLLPCFPDTKVRQKAVEWLNKINNDQMIDYLPQIVQALKYENYETSKLATLLLERSLKCPRIAHHLYWLLVHELPGETPQNTCESSGTNDTICAARYYRRLQLMLRALLAISGDAFRKAFMAQQLLVKGLTEIAESVKISKEGSRLNILMQGLNNLHTTLAMTPTCLPLSPSLFVSGIQVRTSSYFPSYTLPLKINFTSDEGFLIPAIFKVGDDLQQDMLTLQMIRIMDKMWLKEGLDLKMVTFACVPTGDRKGMIELVSEAETLRKIQVEFGLTGSFKDRPIAEWLAKYNPSALEYERAVANFTASCAGYCVATYVLGICDRHNDNIMLKTSGHLFHIDFGKFLGDAQMFGNFKRDRTPFVLTSDMAYVINGGDKASARFHYFVDLCAQAFNIVRKEGNVILNLFGLMASSGAGGLTIDSVRYVQSALLPDLTNAEAAVTFARMIQSSLKSWFTQINFFLHNLAQLRFTGDHNDGELLSFVPKVYTMLQEGRIKSVEVYNYQKRYDPEKYYMYILKVERIGQLDPTYLFRTYKEFCEFHHKLCILFPLAKCHSLQSTSLHMGRSNIKQVTVKRMMDIKKFLASLFKMADEICHSDLVYTFFHPLLRDQVESSIHEPKIKERKRERLAYNTSHIIKGQIKLSLHYQRETLWVMVHHVRELGYVAGGQEPSTYVKVYLLPDAAKVTKRKTKVVRKNCHPSFMEMLEYRMPMEIVTHRYLQATVWTHDTLQENEFLGGITICLQGLDLSEEIIAWYPLGNVHR